MSIMDKLAHDLGYTPIMMENMPPPVPLRALVAEALIARTGCDHLEAMRRADAMILAAVNLAVDGAMQERLREIVGDVA